MQGTGKTPSGQYYSKRIKIVGEIAAQEVFKYAETGFEQGGQLQKHQATPKYKANNLC
ncbi:hypothetical protein [Colwellia piezophila]|uniref:hypothetical protein n=1 Tax=Colwellia piezophila TaxID=211668 RepID=UPI000376DCB7|nr:hypothetical protein [Colwellia piezophila]